MKTTIMVLAIVLGLGGVAVGIYKDRTAFSAQDELNRERYSRMVAEEDLLKATEKLAALEKEVQSIRTRMENSEKMLNQTMSVKKELEAKLDEALDERDSLERRVRELTQSIKDRMTTTGEI